MLRSKRVIENRQFVYIPIPHVKIALFRCVAFEVELGADGKRFDSRITMQVTIWSRIDFFAISIECEMCTIGNKCDLMPSIDANGSRSCTVISVPLSSSMCAQAHRYLREGRSGTVRGHSLRLPSSWRCLPTLGGNEHKPRRQRITYRRSPADIRPRTHRLLRWSAESQRRTDFAGSPHGRFRAAKVDRRVAPLPETSARWVPSLVGSMR